ncbi:YetF domain-containing protein [Hymenobacter bucti]|uniref:YetF domain-containing protein n=1 Tax=Hymenobacter bucti TaxID=1844114 RepID=A0ABW4QTN7_9BACT
MSAALVIFTLMPASPPPEITDYLRILLGEQPASFIAEASLRLVLLYLLMLTALRLMGKRMAGQLSRPELAALVSMAAAIGLPILSPDRGLLASVVIAAVVVLGQRLVTHWAARRARVEQLLMGNVRTVVADGVLQLATLEYAVLSQEQLFAQLRGESLEHLGQVHRCYMEANGTFSLVEAPQPQPGLSLLPSWDQDFRRLQPVAVGAFACQTCGHVQKAPAKPAQPCPHCGAPGWEPAVDAIK